MLRKALATLPPTLDQTYERILCAISEEDSEYALRILQWLTFSALPLSLEEVAEAVAIDVTRNPAFDRDDVIEDPLELLNICSGLVTLTTDNERNTLRPPRRIIALVHYSVQEYLVSDRIRQGQAKAYSMQADICHGAIAKASLQYLLQFQQPLSQQVADMSVLARYSAAFWSSHLLESGDIQEETSLLGIKLLSTESPAYLNWIRLCDPEVLRGLRHPFRYEPDIGRSIDSATTSLYYSARLRLYKIVKLLLDDGADVNTEGGHNGNALQAASLGGHREIAKLLLDRGADINAQGGTYGTAIHAASSEGHNEIVTLLLDKGIDPNAQSDGLHAYALQAASFGGHKETAKLLLDRGANANAQSGLSYNVLQAASSRGHKETVTLLLDRGAEVNTQCGHRVNALRAAQSRGHKETAKLLFDIGAVVNTQCGHRGNALRAASSGGHKEIVMLLLDRGVEVNAQDGFHGNVLQLASFEGYKDTVELLMSRLDTTLQSQDRYGRTLLWWAAAGGDVATVEMLLHQYNLDPQEPDNFGRTPFWIATKKRHDAVSKLLWEEYGEVDIKRLAPPEIDNYPSGVACDVCTSSITKTAFHYHCCVCAGGNWDMCEDCKACGASCAEATHTLVKRTMRNEQWVQWEAEEDSWRVLGSSYVTC